MTATEVCRNCRFSKTQDWAMLCRRYPPDAAGKWGSVHPEDWCGEWMRPSAGPPVEAAPRPKRPTPATMGGF